MNKLKQLFSSSDGGFPIIAYVLPILLFVIGGLVYLSLNIKKDTVKKKIQAASMAVGLQEDINYISTKTKASEVFALSKKEMIKAEKNENFLMARVKRKLDKSVFAKSMGSNDENLAGFDDNLSPIEGHPTLSADSMTAFTEVDSTLANDEVDLLIHQVKTERKSKYHRLEEERKQRLVAAKLENKRKREALEQSTLSAEATAYQKGLANSQTQYAAYNGHTNNVNSKAVNTPKGLSFNTAIGAKNELAFNVKKVPVELAPIDPASNSETLQAVIDQKQKIRNGDKIQLRVLQDGTYQGQNIKANTLLYGLCSLNASRLFINISSISVKNKVLPATLSVYDLDGMPGIYIEGTYQEATKDAINQGLADAGNIGLNNTLGNLSIRLGRKANQKQTAFVPAGYTVLLLDKAAF